ncbi:MAG TPA: SBBP repeat-containing protein, partial [Spirochaetota bacterium]|nr:SBBP repeat-containing protein [Spirochaetota bacterium]
EKTIVGNFDGFLTKINFDSTYGWTKRIGGSGYEYPRALTVDNNGNIYMGGNFQNTVNFSSDWGGTDSKSSNGGFDIFITKINANGTYGWTKTMGSNIDETSRAIAVDNNGNIYMCGYFQNTVDFGSEWGISDSKSSDGGFDIFIMKINSDGTYGWTRRMGGADLQEANAIDVDSAGNIYVTGYFRETVNFGSDWGETDNKTSSGYHDIFITKITAGGEYGWTKQMSGTSFEYANAITVDSIGNIYVSGMFQGSVNFSVDWGGSDSKTSAGGYDVFISKIKANGDYGWTKRIGGASADGAYAVSVDNDDNIYVGGYFAGAINFRDDWGDGIDTKESVGSGDVFITKINADSTYGWTKIIGGESSDSCAAMAISTKGYVHLGGKFMLNVDFRSDWDDGLKDEKTSAGNTDGFITKFYL